MHNTIVENGLVYRLRPMLERDAQYILSLRRHEKNRIFIHKTPEDLGDQRRWIRERMSDQTDYSFTLETRSTSDQRGSFSIYEYDSDRRIARYGRWLTDPKDRLCVAEFALLGYRIIFERLNIETIYARIPEDHTAARAFQVRVGARVNQQSDHFSILSGRKHKLIEYRLEKSDWPRVARLLTEIADLRTKAGKTITNHPRIGASQGRARGIGNEVKLQR